MKWAIGILLYSAVGSLLIAGGYQAGVRDTTSAIRAWAVDQGLAEHGQTEAGEPALIWHTPPQEPQPLPIWMRARK